MWCNSGAAAATRAARDYPGLVGKIKLLIDHRQMRQWIGVDPKNRIIICDVGLARMLDSVSREKLTSRGMSVPEKFEEQKFIFDIEPLHFKMPSRLEVGFVYPAEDQLWAEVISESIGQALLEASSTWLWDIDDKRESIAGDLAGVGIAAFSFQEMCEQFLEEKGRSIATRNQAALRERVVAGLPDPLEFKIPAKRATRG